MRTSALTLLGLNRREDGVWLWSGGPVPPGSAAITLGRLIIMRRSALHDDRLMRHELVHVRQWRELGVARFLVQYLGGYFRGRWHGHGHWDAYRMIPLEVEAEREARGEEGPALEVGLPPQ